MQISGAIVLAVRMEREEKMTAVADYERREVERSTRGLGLVVILKQT